MDSDTLTIEQFEDFRAVIATNLGIKMPPEKKVMLQSRLHRRLRELGLESFEEYHRRFFGDSENQSEELEQLLNVVTTNKTDFFREPDHFDYLAKRVLPEWLRRRPAPFFRVWCAGCSSGEEAYTIAMTLLEERQRADFDFTILATDVSTRVLDIARQAVYTDEQATPIPPAFRSRYLLRSRDKQARQVRIAPEVRAKVRFGHLNFLAPDYGIRETMDAVFFRNVLIYFNREAQQEIVGRICRHLRVGGHLFIAHAETLQSLVLPLRTAGTAVYQRQPGEASP
jgi:chemotaxis protein methyltransferase CheR